MTPPSSLPAIGQRLAARLAKILSRSAQRIHAPVGRRAEGARFQHDAAEGARFQHDATEGASKKSSATGPLIAFDYLHRPVWTPRDYEAFAREAFMQNAIVYRCVRMIAEAAATVPLCLYSGADEIDQHPMLDLVRRPNPYEAGPDLLQAFYGFLLVSGNGYLEAVATNGEVRELHTLRPDRMKVVPGPDGYPEAWEYTVAGRTARIANDPVPGMHPILHMKLFHPANDHYGMSPLEAAATAIDLHNTAAAWNKSLLDNSARPSGALVYASREGNMSAEQYERLKTELETSFQGSGNAGRPLLLEGGLDWKSMSLSPKDMDFIEARHTAAREIALALGVPPMLLGIPGDNTYSNMAEAQRIFWRTTVVPLVQRTATALSNWLQPAFGDNLELRPDLDQLEALSPERDALWSRLEKTTFLTDAEKRALIGYGPKPPVPPPPTPKFNPGQLRIPGGNGRASGRWTDGGGGTGGGGDAAGDGGGDVPDSTDVNTGSDDSSSDNPGGNGRESGQLTTAPDGEGDGNDSPQPINSRRRFGSVRDRQLEGQLADLANQAQRAIDRVRELDPKWEPPQSFLSRESNIEPRIQHQETMLRAAEARLAEITRDAIPGTNPSWGVNRLRKELM